MVTIAPLPNKGNTRPNYIIITPVRDEEPYVEKTIESVVRQTILPSLWIIVDDGSTDGTGEVLDFYAAQINWIKVIHRENRGFRAAGGGVVEAFYAGYSILSDYSWDFIVKLDATLTFAPLVVALFYTAKFAEAVDILRWICLGMALRVITWPMGFIIVAKGKQTLFFGAELAWTVVNVGLAWLCVKSYGLNGAGMALFGSYVFHALMIYPIARKLSGFRWSAENRKTGLIFVSMIAVVFCSFYVLPPLLAIGVGTLAVILSGAYSIRVLVLLISLDAIPSPVARLLVWFRLALPSSS